MPIITVKVEQTFDPQASWATDAMIATATNYWAERVNIDSNGITAYLLSEDVGRRLGEGITAEKRYHASWADVAKAISYMAQGAYLDHDDKRRSLNEYQARACRDLIFNPTEADWDTNTDDLIVQMACIGRVVFG